MAGHLGQQAMAAALAAGPTPEKAITVGQAAFVTAQSRGAKTMQD